MSTLTVATALHTVRQYQSASDLQTLKFAQALAFLQATDPKQYSVRGLVTVAADLARPVGRNRIALLIRAVKEAGPDVTAEDFAAVVKRLTDANRDAKAAPVTADGEEGTPVTGATGTGTVPQGDTATPVADLTPADAVRLLWELVNAHQQSPEFVAAIADAYAFTAPVDLGHLVARVAA